MITDVYRGLGISASTFYRQFPVGSEDYITITEALEFNKIDTKASILDKLLESDKPACLIAAYRLLGTKEEREALNMKEVQNETKQRFTIRVPGSGSVSTETLAE